MNITFSTQEKAKYSAKYGLLKSNLYDGTCFSQGLWKSCNKVRELPISERVPKTGEEVLLEFLMGDFGCKTLPDFGILSILESWM